MTRWPLPLLLLALAGLAPAADPVKPVKAAAPGGAPETSSAAGSWTHWRGPEQTGNAGKVGLPDTFDLSKVGEGNLIWKIPFGGRSAPIVMNGKLFVINGYDPRLPTEGERILCFDAETGKKEWEKKFGVFHSDIVTSRLGWTTLSADPDAGTIFAHTTGGFLFCLDAKDGKTIWERQLTEEFGRVTGYGGRISSPLFDSGIVTVGIISGSWGDQSRGGNRYYGFDSKTGKVVWITEVSTPARPLKGTYYSNSVVAVIGGQRLLITGGADGALHAMKLRTGELVWSYHFGAGVINPSPVVDGNLVYCCHGEENPEGGNIGRVICVDGSQVTNKKPKLVWEDRRSNRFGLASPAIADGRLYVPDDGGELVCFDAKTGKRLWKHKYGTTARGAPLIADGKLYIFEVNAKMTVIKKLTSKEPEDDDVEEHRFRAKSGVGFPETNGTCIAVPGRLYFQTIEDLYCIGDTKAKPPASTGLKPMPAETPSDGKVAGARLFPADVSVKPGDTTKFEVVFFDANGRPVKAEATPKGAWSLPLPPKTPTGAQPPVLAGKIEDGTLTVAAQPPSQGGYVEYAEGPVKARARVRVVAQIPYKIDFEKNPVGGVPGGWVNASGKYVIEEITDGAAKNKVLSKIHTNPLPTIARATTYITQPNSTGYTIQADVQGTLVAEKLPDMGVVANRYLLTLDGKPDPNAGGGTTLRIISWEARLRVNKAVAFAWKPSTWYTLKMAVEVKDGKAEVKGKVWERGTPEPEKWTVEYTDANPNVEGAAGLYGYVANATDTAPGSNIYYDNVSITPTGKQPPKGNVPDGKGPKAVLPDGKK